ncbi:putative type II secretion system protein F [Tepidimonas thermarum]|uniref:Putative type II secretion system protein F n=1 Tax=Tepidimonas thermarum TaxID=335431 RepID=A0A554WY98_9BURK|nr:type II secretion system F family protein [Tepidimonas thermarum]TSE28560.1 putative type II secretion system protein F [Tepidimonas thermarum]
MTETVRYRGIDAQGKPCEGVLQARTLEAARLRLLGQGIRIVELSAGEMSVEPAGNSQRPSLGAADVLLFTRELAQLKRANLPLDKALAILRDLAPTERLKRFVADVTDGIRGGQTLHQSLLPYEAALGRQYLAMIRAGEVSGNLQAALTDLAEQLEANARQRGQLITALTYPAILLGVSVLSVILLLLFVVPQFRDLFDSMGDALPLTTRWVLAFSDAVRLHWQIGLLVALAFFLLVRQWYARPSGRLAVDRLLLRLPVLGDVVAALQSAVYFRTLGMLLQRGVPMLDALRYAAETLTNHALAAEARPLVEHAKAGRRLSDGFAGQRLGERGAAALIRVAEETGQLAPTLTRLGERFEEDSRRVLARLLSMVEPLIIIALGTIVAFIIIAILGGVLSINETI